VSAPPDVPDPVREVPVCRTGVVGARPAGPTRDLVVEERLVELVLGGRTLAHLVCTPTALEDLALGFLVSEGLIAGPAAVFAMAVSADASKVEARADVDPDVLARFLERRAVATGCGGGVTGAADVLPRVESDARFRPEDLSERVAEFQRASVLFRETGGVHAAAVTDGHTLAALAEDIGRHNAVDRVIGRCLRQGLEPARHALLTTGRTSGDIVAKAARVGFPVVVGRGAVTSRAIDLARGAGLTLVGFARGKRMNVYTAAWRLGLAEGGEGGSP